MSMYPGNPDASRRPSLKTVSFARLMAESIGKSTQELDALRADLEAVDNDYALTYVRYIGGALATSQGKVTPFQPPEEAVVVQVPEGGPWRTAYVGQAVSGVWFQSYYAQAIGTFADSTSVWPYGVLGTVELWWIDNNEYTQLLESRINVVPVWPRTTSFRLELSSTLTAPANLPQLILPIPVWFTRRAAIHGVAQQGI